MTTETISEAARTSSTEILDEAAAVLGALDSSRLPHLTIERLVVGVFFTGVVLSDGSGGVAYTPPEAIQRASTRILKGVRPSYRRMLVQEAINSGASGPFAHVIRLATLNALSARLFQGRRYTVLPDGDLTDYFPWLLTGRRVCLVGAIIPLLKRIGALGAAEVTVIDKKKETKAEAPLGNFVPMEQATAALAACQTAIFTGAAVANGSVAELLAAVPADAAVAIVGPTAGFIPDPLFRRGVALVGTAIVTDGERALEILAEGGGAHELGKTCLRKINLINERRIDELRQQVEVQEPEGKKRSDGKAGPQ